MNRNNFSLLVSTMLILLFNSACKQRKAATPLDNQLSYIWLDSLVEKNIISENLSKCKFVKLETTEDCLIAWIDKIEFADDKIFILDGNQKIFVFDNEGKFLNTISQIGPGPDELLNMYGFYIDKKTATVHVCDMFKSTIFKYTYSGKLLDREQFDRSVLKDAFEITTIDDRYTIVSLSNNNTSVFNYGIWDRKKNERKDCLPYLVTGSSHIGESYSSLHQIAILGESVYMCSNYSDTLYTYDVNTNNIIPKWVFKGVLPPTTKDDLKGDYELAGDSWITIKRKGLSRGIMSLYMTDHYIHFTSSWDDKCFRYLIFFNTDTRTGYYYPYLPTDIFRSLNGLITTTNDAFVCVIAADDALFEKDVEVNAELKNILDNTIEDDNPILAFYYLD